MNSGNRVPGFSDVRQIGVMGDVHGDLGHTLQVATMFARRGVTTLVQLGDAGFIHPGENWGIVVGKLSRRLARLGSTLYFIPGNHDAYALLARFPVGQSGLHWIRANVAFVPRGWRTVLGDRHTFASLGGANSIDREYRTAGRDWWPQERILNADLARLGHTHADVLAGHEAPLFVPSLDRHLSTLPRWPADAETYALESRQMFHRAVLQTRPRLTLSGHYHCHIDEQVTFSDEGSTFLCRVVVLDKEGPGISQAILNTQTLGLTFLHRDGTEAIPTPKGPTND
ncbi:MAG: metallophosphoesterase [Mycetocola sp.]